MINRLYTIVFIDDSNDFEFTQDRIGDRVASGNCNIIVFSDRDCLNSRTRRNGVYNGLSDSFKSFLKTTSIDVIACDVNLGDGKNDQGMHACIIKDIKNINKTVSILSYSGDIGSQIAYTLLDTNSGQTVPSKITNMLNTLLNSCNAFVVRRETPSKINELLRDFSLERELEYALINNFSENIYTFADESKKTGAEIATLIRCGETKSFEFINHASDFGIANIGALFS